MDYLLNTPEENDAATINTSTSVSSGRASNQNSMNGTGFAPNQDALQTLQEMGYERDDAIYALRVTGNNLEHACTYLMSNPNPSANQGLGHYIVGGPSNTSAATQSSMAQLSQ
jgi:uncharacterized UBP type Zn finger protein